MFFLFAVLKIFMEMDEALSTSHSRLSFYPAAVSGSDMAPSRGQGFSASGLEIHPSIDNNSRSSQANPIVQNRSSSWLTR
jgi:hypothetical protein